VSRLTSIGGDSARRRSAIGKYIVLPRERLLADTKAQKAVLLIVATDTFRGHAFGPDRHEASLRALTTARRGSLWDCWTASHEQLQSD
jgi:hypothetical protein